MKIFIDYTFIEILQAILYYLSEFLDIRFTFTVKQILLVILKITIAATALFLFYALWDTGYLNEYQDFYLMTV